MMQILLNALLVLFIIWLLLLIRYTYYYIQFSHRYDKKAQEQARVEQQKEEAHILVGKSKGLSSSDFPKVPETPSTAETPENANTFAPQESEESDEEGEISEEENEMQIAFTADEVNEDEVVQEELPLSRDPMPEVSPSAILARDLVRMGRWAKNDDELDEEDEVEVQVTLGKVQGSDLMEKYLEHLKAEEGKHSKLLAFVRKAEEKQRQAEELGDEGTQTINTNDTHPLDYYL